MRLTISLVCGCRMSKAEDVLGPCSKLKMNFEVNSAKGT